MQFLRYSSDDYYCGNGFLPVNVCRPPLLVGQCHLLASPRGALTSLPSSLLTAKGRIPVCLPADKQRQNVHLPLGLRIT